MAMRLKYIDLEGIPANVPYKITLQCAYWSIRVFNLRLGNATLNGSDLTMMANSTFGAEEGTVSIDFPPVFDENGRPCMWNDEIVIFKTVAILGSITMAVWDPSRKESPAR